MAKRKYTFARLNYSIPAALPGGKKATFLNPRNYEFQYDGSIRLSKPGETMPLLGKDFLVDTATSLTAEQGMIYLRLLIHVWYSGNPLWDDDEILSRTAYVSRTKFKNQFRPIADRFFEIADGVWRPNAGHVDAPQSKRQGSLQFAALRRKVLERDNHTCSYCHQRKSQMEVDHIIPIARGGSNDAENLTAACKECNWKKGGQTAEEWLGTNWMKPFSRHSI